MSYKLRILDSTWEEIAKHSSYYENSREGYGEKFEDKFFEKLSLLKTNPFQGTKLSARGREFRFIPFPTQKPRFAHVIVFYVNEDSQTIDILDVPHMSSDWKKGFSTESS